MTGLDEENRNAVFCRGNSMRPLFCPGDRIISPAVSKTYGKGM